MRRPHVYERSAPRKKLTAQQQTALDLLRSRGGEWFNGCGWCLGQAADCNKAMGSLVKLGLAVRLGERGGFGHYRCADADAAATDAEQDRKAQDRAWSGRLGIMRQ